MIRKVIIDGDWGGDEMQLASVLLAQPRQVKVLGATAVFGNTNHDQVVRNAGDILYLLKAPSVPFYAGAKAPTGSEAPEGDMAHGSDGVGGVILPRTPACPQTDSGAADFILETLRREPDKSVTITATGPLTNLAQAFHKDPETMKRVAQIVIMGGCTEEIPAADRPLRKGNITPDAEFNFYMAAQDAQTVLSSGLPITLFPMNCTQQLSVTPERKEAIRQALLSSPGASTAVVDMMTAPAELDRMKFNSPPFMHDVHTALFLLHPELYEGCNGTVNVAVGGETNGRTDFRREDNGPVRVMEKVKNPDKLFSYVLESLKTCIAPQKDSLKSSARR